MAQHQQITDELQEKASLFAAGALTNAERADFARHLEEDDCAVCRTEVGEFESAVNLLAFDAAFHFPGHTDLWRSPDLKCNGRPAHR